MKRVTAAFLASLVALAATPSVALECVYGSVQQNFWWHKESAETYVPVHDVFSNLKLIELVSTSETAAGTQIGKEVFSTLFEGFRPSRHAFDQPFSTKATLVFSDESYIGGGPDTAGEAEGLPGKVGLVWLLQTEKSYQVTANA